MLVLLPFLIGTAGALPQNVANSASPVASPINNGNQPSGGAVPAGSASPVNSGVGAPAPSGSVSSLNPIGTSSAPAGSASVSSLQPIGTSSGSVSTLIPTGSSTPAPGATGGAGGVGGAGGAGGAAGGGSGSNSSFSPTPVSTVKPEATNPAFIVPGQNNPPNPQWWCNNEGNATYCPNILLQDVQLSGIFEDSKTFVDRPTNGSAAEVFQAWTALNSSNVTSGQVLDWVTNYTLGEGQELSQVPIQRNSTNVTTQSNISDPIFAAWVDKVDSYWNLLVREVNQSSLCNGTNCDSSLIPLNHTQVVAGGRYREVYYWDSYWILQGLLASNLDYYAWSLLQNFMDLIEDYGFIPNGARKYYLNRSQPPVFVQMVHEYLKQTGNVTILERALPSMEQELAWWHQNRTLNVTSPWTDKNYTVAHYGVNNSAPRPEGYKEDYATANDPQQPLNSTQQAALYAELATGAESGWDYSARWLTEPVANTSDNAAALRHLNVRAIVPVDLNALMAGNHALLADMYETWTNYQRNQTSGGSGSNQTQSQGGGVGAGAVGGAGGAQSGSVSSLNPIGTSSTGSVSSLNPIGTSSSGSVSSLNPIGTSSSGSVSSLQPIGTSSGSVSTLIPTGSSAPAPSPTGGVQRRQQQTGNEGNTGNAGSQGGNAASGQNTGNSGNAAQGGNDQSGQGMGNTGTDAGNAGNAGGSVSSLQPIGTSSGSVSSLFPVGTSSGSVSTLIPTGSSAPAPGATGGTGGAGGAGSQGNQTHSGGGMSGNSSVNGTEHALKHRAFAKNFREALLDLNWDADKAFFYDFNTTNSTRSPVYSAGGLWPLWQNVTPSNLTEEQALRMVSGTRYLLQRYDGPPAAATYLVSGLNWDFPNVWPPHVYTTIKGLETLERVLKNATVLPQLSITNFSAVTTGQLGLNETQLPQQPTETRGNVSYANATQHILNANAGSLPWPRGLALEIATRYLDSAFCSWYSTGGQLNGTLQRLPLSELNASGTYHEEPGVEGGKMFEKFNITDLDAAGGGGEYTVQIGFGWTNGVVLWAAERFGKHLGAPTCPLILITSNNGTSTNSTGTGSGAGGAGGASSSTSSVVPPVNSTIPTTTSPYPSGNIVTSSAAAVNNGNGANNGGNAVNGGGNNAATSSGVSLPGQARSFQFVGRRVHA